MNVKISASFVARYKFIFDILEWVISFSPQHDDVEIKFHWPKLCLAHNLLLPVDDSDDALGREKQLSLLLCFSYMRERQSKHRAVWSSISHIHHEQRNWLSLSIGKKYFCVSKLQNNQSKCIEKNQVFGHHNDHKQKRVIGLLDYCWARWIIWIKPGELREWEWEKEKKKWKGKVKNVSKLLDSHERREAMDKVSFIRDYSSSE